MTYLGTKPANTVVTSEQIADGVISTNDLANNAVTQAKLGANVAGNGPTFSAYQSSATSLTHNTYTKILFANEIYDTNNNFASSTFTPTVAGYYQLNASVSFANGQTSRTRLVFYKNGAQSAVGADTTTGFICGQVCNLMYLNGSTDYVEVYVFQSSGISQLTEPTIYNTFFNGSLVRAA